MIQHKLDCLFWQKALAAKGEKPGKLENLFTVQPFHEGHDISLVTQCNEVEREMIS